MAGETDFKFFPRAQANSFRLEDEKVIETGQAHSREEEIHGVDGIHWFWITRVPLFDSGNAVSGLLVSGQDITTQKNAEQAQGNLAQKITILYDAEKALGEISESDNEWENILTWAGKLADTAHVGLWQIIPEQSTAILKAGCGKLETLAGAQIRAGAEIVWKVWQTRHTEWIPDYQPDSSREGWIKTESFSAALGVPLFLKSQVVFVLSLFFDQPNLAMSEEEIELLSMFGQIASINLQYDERAVGYQSEIDEWRHKLDDLSLRYQTEIEEWNHKQDELAVRHQMDSKDWGHKLDAQAASHLVEIGEWKQKLEDQKVAHQNEIDEWKRKLDAVQYRARL
jgi:hypothetical protein